MNFTFPVVIFKASHILMTIKFSLGAMFSISKAVIISLAHCPQSVDNRVVVFRENF